MTAAAAERRDADSHSAPSEDELERRRRIVRPSASLPSRSEWQHIAPAPELPTDGARLRRRLIDQGLLRPLGELGAHEQLERHLEGRPCLLMDREARRVAARDRGSPDFSTHALGSHRPQRHD